MERFLKTASAVLAVLLPAAAAAENGPMGYTYATYYVCDVATQANMDNVVEINEKRVFDQWVAEEKMLDWGYLSHSTGGRWRRLHYHVAPTIDDVLRNQAAVFSSIYAGNAVGAQARAAACASHDDYIWSIDQGSAPGAGAGDVRRAAYFVCDINREARADAIVRQIHAPLLDALVEDDRLSGWNWQSHVLGGEFRRLAVLEGGDHASVVQASLEMQQTLRREHPQLLSEFNAICGAHTDYLWDVVH
ncbi:MAG: hypothetical protein U5K76_10500 [Woeseiaceae bacterium]|nr:hypothetical protein [Woeseiaceae bacterium]